MPFIEYKFSCGLEKNKFTEPKYLHLHCYSVQHSVNTTPGYFCKAILYLQAVRITDELSIMFGEEPYMVT